MYRWPYPPRSVIVANVLAFGASVEFDCVSAWSPTALGASSDDSLKDKTDLQVRVSVPQVHSQPIETEPRPLSIWAQPGRRNGIL